MLLFLSALGEDAVLLTFERRQNADRTHCGYEAGPSLLYKLYVRLSQGISGSRKSSSLSAPPPPEEEVCVKTAHAPACLLFPVTCLTALCETS